MVTIYGKSDIYKFKIKIEDEDNIKAFDFLQVKDEELRVLCYVTNISREKNLLLGECRIIGQNIDGILKGIKIPLSNDSIIEIADSKFIKKIIGISTSEKDFLGYLDEHEDIKINLNLKKLITKHLAVLAKSGAGKSYTVGVILEEIMKKEVPILIIDPHSEYGSIKDENDNEKDISRLKYFGLKPRGFKTTLKEFTPNLKLNPNGEEIKLDISKLKSNDLMNLMPQKLTTAGQSLIINTLNNMGGKIDFDGLIFNLANEESTAKWPIINSLEQVKKYKIFSDKPTKFENIIKYGRASILSLKGCDPNISEIFVSQLLTQLFEDRKSEKIPPFFLVIEEAHNFCPERSLGEVKSSKIIRTIAAEGRKFGLGLCVITQRPAKIDKNVISQCSTQIILKLTNPADLKAVISSSEGVNSDSEQEIQALNIGSCLLTGLVDLPLKINVRPRISKHGGETVDIKLNYEKNIEEIPKEIKPKNNNLSMFEILDVEFSKNKKILLVPILNLKLKVKEKIISIYINKLNFSIIKSFSNYLDEKLNVKIFDLSETQKKIMKDLLKLNDNFNPNTLLENPEYNYSQINKTCEFFEQNNFIRKEDKNYKFDKIKNLANIENYSNNINIKLEEIEIEEKYTEKISTEKIKSFFSPFFEIEETKDVFVVFNKE